MRWRLRVTPTVVLSDDPQASSRIGHFADGTQPWIIAVRMVSEGVDIPRLAIGVYATTTTTELFFRQAVGRLVRWTPGVVKQKAYLFIPDDPRLRTWAHQIAEARRHSLRKPGDDRDGFEGRAEADPGAFDPLTMPDEQLSLFSALSSVATETSETEVMVGGSVFDDDYEDSDPEPFADAPDHSTDDLLLDVGALAPPLVGGQSAALDGTSRYEHKEALRLKNAEWARDLARATGMNHGQVNGQLNRLINLARVDSATVEQLEQRVAAAEKWWRQLSGRR